MVTNPPRKNRKKQLRTTSGSGTCETTAVNMTVEVSKMSESMAMKYYFERLVEDAKDMLQTQVSMLRTILHSDFSPDDSRIMLQITHQIKNIGVMFETLENIQLDKDEYEKSVADDDLPRKKYVPKF